MKKNYITPNVYVEDMELEGLLNLSAIEEGADKDKEVMSKDRSTYSHEDLGWDY